MLYILVDMSMSYMYQYTLYNFCKIKNPQINYRTNFIFMIEQNLDYHNHVHLLSSSEGQIKKPVFLHASSSFKKIIMFHLFTTTFIFFEYSVLVVNESKDNIALLCQL